MIKRSHRYFVKQRLQRYAPGEFFATSGALLGGYLVSQYTLNPVWLGYAGARGENVCYYGYFLYKEYADQKLFHGKKISLWTTFVGMMSEFGPGELLDSFVVKPLFMGWGSQKFGTVGFIVGKYMADIIYYSLATFLYKHKMKKRIDLAEITLENKVAHIEEQIEKLYK